MKTKTILFSTVVLLLAASCEKWTTPCANELQSLQGTPKSDEYYENLRAYKKTDHPVAFGWFGNWSGGKGGVSLIGSLNSAPDSIDIMSIWSKTWYNLDEERKADLKYVQKVKGTRITFTVFSHNMINLFPENCQFENTAENIPAAAKALADTIFKYGFDGIDFDHECSRNDLFYDKDNMTALLREMRANLGPDKLIMVDGNLTLITEEGWSYADYAISQAYNKGSSSLTERYNQIKKYVEPSRFIVTENFESYSSTGGKFLEQAAWNPAEGRKGGCGTYHMEYEFNNDYKFMRKAIQMMNPAGQGPSYSDDGETETPKN